MPRDLPRWVHWDKKAVRGGTIVRAPRFWRRPGPKVWMRAAPGTPEFQEEYAALVAGGGRAQEAPRTLRPGSLSAFAHAYETSAEFRNLAPSTRAARSRILARVAAQAPDGNPRAINAADIRRMRDNRAATPDAANVLVKTLRALFRWGMEHGWTAVDPTEGVRKLPPLRRGGHPTASADDVAKFRKRWPLGTDERLALEVFLFSAARISDVARMGPHTLEAGRLRWTQHKNRTRTPLPVEIPSLAPLRAALEARDAARAATPLRAATWWLTAHGRPRTPKGFENWWRDACREAKVAFTAHGLRKAAGAILGEAGCSQLEIAAVLGHADPATASIYTTGANRAKLAESAAGKMEKAAALWQRDGQCPHAPQT